MSLTLRGITVTYRGSALPTVLDLDLDVPAGTSLALMGPSGAGKSTVLAVAGLLLEPDRGEVLVAETPRTVRDAPTVLGDELGWVLQTVNLLPRRTALDNVTLPALARGRRRAASEDRARELLDAVGITAHDQVARTLSGGQAQRVGVARALMTSPAVIVADEPTANLDLATARSVARTLFEATAGTTVLLATHDPAIAEMADRVVYLEPVTAPSPTQESADVAS
ncbi:ATP-binding cassette domain-containing protein [Cellulosimicrobium cellulans]|uniref:ABC transporter ATP-binding protein n=1 Tax=Cellulosimicrobium cellulans TaxID=1710 RepID=UPI002149ED90|nr:ATP-binding cassette domain-containing protein [Cellulosimicrobium cellulans]